MSRRVVQRLPIAVPAAVCRATRTLWPTSLPSSPPQTPTTPAALAVPSRTVRVPLPARAASSASSTRWKTRQGNDSYAREAKLAGLKSRAAFKLLEINDKYRLFKKGDTVVDLGFAPGSWSQVAANRTSPGGRVVGIDVIPAQPPKGVSTLQGDFLSPEIRAELRKYVSEAARGRPRVHHQLLSQDAEDAQEESGATQDDLDAENKGILELEKAAGGGGRAQKLNAQRQLDEAEGRVVDVVLSDMSEPWPLVTSTWIKSVSNPWRRMMNTSGMAFRDHAGSMDLCLAALDFSYDTMATGGHFLCKFYQGAEDHALEMRLKKLFERVHRIKPDSSRKESKEAYLVGLRRKAGVEKETVLGGD
ncbi:FtsJ-domain-containing protein [Teratosphaeria nubilosa]|uniref:rRNA methyltransferase 2, mitochondrial n=1 Tax=Teratosphaeria nubilosa TaxID=161662 RepID=A0A6G1KTI8_9PEZI|nr:FtsJ-domain-containing protein [Teratosphaeria nubilosa]